MPQSITIAAFAFGAVLLLIALMGGGFKLFGAEISGTTGRVGRGVAGILGVSLLALGIDGSIEVDRAPPPTPSVTPTSPPTEPPTVGSPEHNVAEADNLLVQTANTINRQLPMMVDQRTRLDSTVGGPGKRFTYLYTIVTHRAADVDRTQLYGATAPTIRNSACTNQKLEIFLKNGVTVSYSYRGNDGAFVMEVPVTPNDCGYR